MSSLLGQVVEMQSNSSPVRVTRSLTTALAQQADAPQPSSSGASGGAKVHLPALRLPCKRLQEALADKLPKRMRSNVTFKKLEGGGVGFIEPKGSAASGRNNQPVGIGSAGGSGSLTQPAASGSFNPWGTTEGQGNEGETYTANSNFTSGFFASAGNEQQSLLCPDASGSFFLNGGNILNPTNHVSDPHLDALLGLGQPDDEVDPFWQSIFKSSQEQEQPASVAAPFRDDAAGI